MTKEEANNLLFEGAEKGDLRKVKEALENGADIYARDNYALRLSSSGGH